MSNKEKRGWSVHVQIEGFKDGARRPESWAELPVLVAKNLQAISEAPEVEYMMVDSGAKRLAAFAPRDAEGLAALLEARAPSLAALLRERRDGRLAEEVRGLLASSPAERG